MDKKILSIVFGILVISLVVGYVAKPDNSISEGIEVMAYKSLSCGCCEGHLEELDKKGFMVNLNVVNNIGDIKEKYNIPSEIESCHTSIIGGYVIEGHVPVEAVEKLLEEKPDVEGIALKGMPAGSAGMPGIKTEVFEIYSFKDGEISKFMEI